MTLMDNDLLTIPFFIALGSWDMSVNETQGLCTAKGDLIIVLNANIIQTGGLLSIYCGALA